MLAAAAIATACASDVPEHDQGARPARDCPTFELAGRPSWADLPLVAPLAGEEIASRRAATAWGDLTVADGGAPLARIEWGSAGANLAFTIVSHESGDAYGAKVIVDQRARRFDLQSVLVHELGHVLGLPDVEDGGRSVMDPRLDRGERRRSPTRCDREALRELYARRAADAGIR